jgi:hypothetical protein
MSTVLSALAVVAALIASGVILVQLFMSESRRGNGQAEPRPPKVLRVRPVQPERQAVPVRVVPAAPAGHVPLPERMVPPPPAPRVRRIPVRTAPVRPVQTSWAGTLSPDGAWLWTGSAWVPAWWGGPTVPPPPQYVAAPAPPPAARSHGCLAAFGMGCAVVLGIVALIVLVVIAETGGLSGLMGG